MAFSASERVKRYRAKCRSLNKCINCGSDELETKTRCPKCNSAHKLIEEKRRERWHELAIKIINRRTI